MKVLVLGAGMYVTGRGATGNGTVLAALAQYGRAEGDVVVEVMARSAGSVAAVRQAAERINAALSSSLKVHARRIPGLNLESEIDEACRRDGYDAAVVALPDHLHAAPVRALMRCGVPTLVVKPFTPTAAEALELVALQRRHHVYGMVEFHKRFDETNLYAKRLLGEGGIGRCLYMSVDYSQRISVPTLIFRDWVDRTNIFQYLGVHYVDLAYFLFGYRPVRLTAHGVNGVLREKGIDAFDSIHVMLEWVDPITGSTLLTQYNTNWIDPDCSSAMSDQRYKIVGTRGRLEIDQRNRGIELVREGEGVRYPNPYFSEFLPGPDGVPEFQGYGYKSIACFIDDVRALRAGSKSLEQLESCRPTFGQSLVSTAVVDAVNAALGSPGQWRNVDDLSR